MSRITPLCILAALLLQTTASSEPADAKRFPAFPGAEGAGAYTPGGRGGKVLLVTTLEDYNPKTEKPIPGSLRAAVNTKGPRTIVIKVAGNIDLKASLNITEPYVTIAGQKPPATGSAYATSTSTSKRTTSSSATCAYAPAIPSRKNSTASAAADTTSFSIIAPSASASTKPSPPTAIPAP
jgi:hypothetical protein